MKTLKKQSSDVSSICQIYSTRDSIQVHIIFQSESAEFFFKKKKKKN